MKNVKNIFWHTYKSYKTTFFISVKRKLHYLENQLNHAERNLRSISIIVIFMINLILLWSNRVPVDQQQACPVAERLKVLSRIDLRVTAAASDTYQNLVPYKKAHQQPCVSKDVFFY